MSSQNAHPTAQAAARPRDLEDEGMQEGTYFLGRYRVVDEIGVGGMASVHLARMDGDGGFQKWVAIKKIHPHLITDELFIDMFLDEARIAAKISHPNVAQVFDLGGHDNTYWIAMEYLQGEPLREVMRRCEENKSLPEPEVAAYIVADAAEGLHAAHELRGNKGDLLNLVHRDVSPHNLFLTYDGLVKVVDFGIAKVSDRLSRTRAGTLKGKVAYMSPEQVRGGDIDRRTDIFALGVVFWELVTGKRLFRMETEIETLEKVRMCLVAPPSELRPGFPAELEAIVFRALDRNPDRRYQTARDFSRALRRYIMRSGRFVGREEVATFVSKLFGDHIRQKQEHLRWAAEVTGTLSASPDGPIPDRPAPSAKADDEEATTMLASPPRELSNTVPAPHKARKSPTPPTAPAAPVLLEPEEMEDDDEEEEETATVPLPAIESPEDGAAEAATLPHPRARALAITQATSRTEQTLKLAPARFPLKTYVLVATVTFLVVLAVGTVLLLWSRSRQAPKPLTHTTQYLEVPEGET